MSKAIIASDIHGNLTYTNKLIEFINQENPEYILLLGDLFSDHRKEIADLLNKYSDQIYAVKGNNDREEDQQRLQFRLQEYCRIKIDNLSFFLNHGHSLYKYRKEIKEDYILSGHSHVYQLFGKNINPGSVGRPRINKEHTCILYNNKKLYLINLEDFSILERRDLSEK